MKKCLCRLKNNDTKSWKSEKNSDRNHQKSHLWTAYIKTSWWLASLLLFACSEMTFLTISIPLFFLLFFMGRCPKRHRPFLFVALRSLVSFYSCVKKVMLSFVICRFSPRPYMRIILGVAKDTRFGVLWGSTLKKMLGVTPSMRVFGSRFSHARFDTRLGRRPENPYIYIYIYIYIFMDFPDIDPGRSTGDVWTRPRRDET